MTNALYDPPPVVSREKALEILGPHMNELRDSILAGWDAWTKMLSEDEERLITLTKTARARIIHDYAVKAATAKFDGQPGIRLRPEHDSLLIVFGTEVIVQVRHLDDGLMRCYTKTRRQDEILRQEFCLPEVAEEATTLTLLWGILSMNMKILLTRLLSRANGSLPTSGRRSACWTRATTCSSWHPAQKLPRRTPAPRRP